MMDRVTVLCLVLVLGCLLAAELAKTEITEQSKARPETANVPEQQQQQQPCPSDVHAVLREMSVKLAMNTLMIQQLQTLYKGRQVAFSASLAFSDPVDIGPNNREINLVFPNVFLNQGSAYSPTTGFFTAPVRGVYHFEYYIAARGGSRGSAVGLRKNGQHIVSTWEHQTNGQSKSANGVSLLLEPNDTVGLYIGANLVMWDNHHHHSTFSGHMLFPM